jgi:hypothetical protein
LADILPLLYRGVFLHNLLLASVGIKIFAWLPWKRFGRIADIILNVLVGLVVILSVNGFLSRIAFEIAQAQMR